MVNSMTATPPIVNRAADLGMPFSQLCDVFELPSGCTLSMSGVSMLLRPIASFSSQNSNYCRHKICANTRAIVVFSSISPVNQGRVWSTYAALTPAFINQSATRRMWVHREHERLRILEARGEPGTASEDHRKNKYKDAHVCCSCLRLGLSQAHAWAGI